MIRRKRSERIVQSEPVSGSESWDYSFSMLSRRSFGDEKMNRPI